MPELPEVETVKNTLKLEILNKTIKCVEILYNLIDYPGVDEFKKQIKNQTIIDIKRRGKWLMFELNDYYLLSHLRMEGKYHIRKYGDKIDKHEHLIFRFNDDTELRYNDTRKFGKFHLIEKDKVYKVEPLCDLGLEPWDIDLNINYLKEKYKSKKLPIKTVLLNQSIITGIGNIYADEILFLSGINPLKKCNELSDLELNNIIKYTKEVLEKAIELGGTTIKSYESSEGVHGKFQNNLLVHNKDICPNCGNIINKIKVNGRGTYYCENCQKMEEIK